jgi:hypothetical protein
MLGTHFIQIATHESKDFTNVPIHILGHHGHHGNFSLEFGITFF